jgi:hypothetical protein
MGSVGEVCTLGSVTVVVGGGVSLLPNSLAIKPWYCLRGADWVTADGASGTPVLIGTGLITIGTPGPTTGGSAVTTWVGPPTHDGHVPPTTNGPALPQDWQVKLAGGWGNPGGHVLLLPQRMILVGPLGSGWEGMNSGEPGGNGGSTTVIISLVSTAWTSQ